jgi:hypothetical protein
MVGSRLSGEFPSRWRAAVLVVCMVQCLATAPAAGGCAGDCNGDGTVGVDELVTLVDIALGNTPLSVCTAGDTSQDGQISIDEILAAVNSALHGCAPQPVMLHAAVHFDQPAEAINQQLIGTGGTAPSAAMNELLNTTVHPPSMRLDVGFEDSGCPDNSVTGPLYDPGTNTFNYCRLDERLERARAAGATPLLIIDYTPLALAEPTCAANNGHGFGTQHCPPADFEKYGALVEAMVQHVFTIFGVTEFEVWNEPDGLFFAGTQTDYLHLYATCNAAVGRVEAMLGRPGRTFRLGGPATASANHGWISALLTAAVAQPDLRVDFISWHNYANRALGATQDPRLYAGTYGDDTTKVRGWVAPFQTQRTDLAPFLWIDEWNVNAFYDYRSDTSYDAAFMVAALHGMQDAGLDRSARFNTWDSSPASPEGFNGNWGLFTHDSDVRPALFGFALWRQLAATRVAVELLDAASQARAGASRTRYSQNLLESIDADAARATVLLYNFVAYSPSDAAPPYCGGGPSMDATLELDGLAAGTYQVAVQQVDCQTPIQPLATASLASSIISRAIAPGASLELTAPADSVLLVALTPVP